MTPRNEAGMNEAVEIARLRVATDHRDALVQGGRDACKQVFADFADAWPVRDFVIDDSFAVADKVVVRFTATTVFDKDAVLRSLQTAP